MVGAGLLRLLFREFLELKACKVCISRQKPYYFYKVGTGTGNWMYRQHFCAFVYNEDCLVPLFLSVFPMFIHLCLLIGIKRQKITHVGVWNLEIKNGLRGWNEISFDTTHLGNTCKMHSTALVSHYRLNE